jgi:hypothetical protein
MGKATLQLALAAALMQLWRQLLPLQQQQEAAVAVAVSQLGCCWVMWAHGSLPSCCATLLHTLLVPLASSAAQ